MKAFTLLSLLATAITSITKVNAAADPNFHIYLAFGQSNMEGAGDIGNQDRQVDSRFKMLSTVSGCNRQLGNWYDAIPPLAHCGGKLGPVDWFGRTLTKKLPESIKVGVVVVAVAGCDIQLFEEANYQTYEVPDWMEGRIASYGGNPYRRLVNMAKKAQESGVIKGILLHQGETNNGQIDWPDRVKVVYERLLNELDLKAEDVPLIAGEVVRSEYDGLCSLHNEVIATLPKVIPTAHVVSAEGLEPQEDNLHFSSQSYRELGARYAEVMLDILKNETAAPVEAVTEYVTEYLDDSDCEDEAVEVSDEEVEAEEDSADEN